MSARGFIAELFDLTDWPYGQTLAYTLTTSTGIAETTGSAICAKPPMLKINGMLRRKASE